ncbi:ATP-dependent DNA helicase DinG [Bacillus suaedae]|uniref:3'-5' exonuclease DinG n=1 Tax=Halalkalibacter suaedae TaxID=2822140 RepID=A0A941AT17_9BACI|nr:ATP-dependent DNA helicase DinG [Bacillus suaedae]MBP3950624.1 ATP-dependent DNA helicase DinG [Bacillus suaedae]
MNKRYVVIDIETTGHSVTKGDRIIQIGAVVISGNEIVDTYSTFVNPGMAIPPFIRDLTGITDEMVENAPTFHSIIPTLVTLLDQSQFVAHNVDFDRTFLQRQMEMEGYDFPNLSVFDTVELSRILLPKQESYKLSQLAEQLGYDHDRPHQADSDADVTATLFLKLLHKLEQLPLLTLQTLAPMSRKFKSDLEPLLDEIILRKLTFHKTEEDYDCFRQLALKKMPAEEKKNAPTDIQFSEFLATTFEEKMSSAFDHYELRQGQKQMMVEVDEAFQLNEYKLIEAGTGTGKSLAYLLPAVFFARNTNQPVIISTQTIPLQEQLLSRDLPLIEKLIPFSVKIALLKGRSHYLCLRKFEQSLQAEHDSYDVLLTKSMLLVWLTETETGDVEEINIPTGAKAFWYEVQSNAADDLGRFSPWLSRCFYHRARQNALQADIVITNHSLLCTDLVNEQRILPSYTHAIIDEAHHLEETASSHLGINTDYFAFSHIFQRFGIDQEFGWHEQMVRLLEQHKLPMANLGTNSKRLILLKEEIDELFRMLHAYVLRNRQASSTDVGRIRYRYNSYQEYGTQWQSILECTMRVHMQTKDTLADLRASIKPLTEIKEQLAYSEKAQLADLEGLIESLYEQEQNLYELLLEADPNVVYWIEIEPRGARNATYLYSKPIDVAELLADKFFAKKKSVILTSATLSVNGSFSYQERRLGLEDFAAKTCIIPSPFSYIDQAKLLLPTDIPAIKDVPDTIFAMELASKLWRVADVTKGKMLVLFTSYEMLRQVYENVKDLNEFGTLQLIGQGVTTGSRAKLMKMFKQSEHAILFGTSSFWEGIDLPGDELRTVVIVRLPFSPPDEPLLQAQYEKAKQEGQNPFMSISLPQAIIRFKQGFGRLIRTSRDKGSVFVFDRRISTSRYGKQFIKSLPDISVQEGKLEDLLEQNKEYL